jgi:hypothetical protein
LGAGVFGEAFEEGGGDGQDLAFGVRQGGHGGGQPGVAAGHVVEQGLAAGIGEGELDTPAVGLAGAALDQGGLFEFGEQAGEGLGELAEGGGEIGGSGGTVAMEVAQHGELVGAEAILRTLRAQALGEADDGVTDFGGLGVGHLVRFSLVFEGV